MHHTKLCILLAITFLLLATIGFAQAPNLGSTVNFVLFSTDGAVTNTGSTRLTGNIGTNNGSSTGFGNVNGVIHDGDGASAQCASDLLLAYNQLNSTVAGFFPASLLGNGQTLTAGVYSIGSAATLDLTLNLDAQNDPNAVFIFKIQGSFATGAGAKVKLINGALACNVFWKVEGMVNMATATSMKGTVIANNAAITMNVNDTLEGRAMSTAGAVTVHGMLAYTPTGCGSSVLTGPAAPALASATCYAIFSSSGAVTNSGVTHVTGDIGTNSGTTTGFDTSFVIGTVHTIPDASTAQCATDLHNVYTYLNTLPYDIQLLYPAQFGNSLILTPHTYLLDAATTLTDTVFLDAQGDANAVFVLKINGAFSTGTYACVKLINGAQSQNVFWKVEGAVSINNYSVFCGTMVVNNGAITAINTGVTIDGRVFTTTGSITTTAITAVIPPGCSTGAPAISTQPLDQTVCLDSSASFTVIASGASLSYQWRKGTTILNNGGDISGANTAILTISPAMAADTSSLYNVRITGSSTVIYANTSLTLQMPAVITSAPASQMVCAGNPATFAAAGNSSTISYQWRKGAVNLIDGGRISGANTAALTIDTTGTADSASDYNVILMGACVNDTSANVSLTLCPTGIAYLNDVNTSITIYPNPFSSSINIRISDVKSSTHYQFKMYNILGEEVLSTEMTKQVSEINTAALPSGMYIYHVIHESKIIQSGKMISQK